MILQSSHLFKRMVMYIHKGYNHHNIQFIWQIFSALTALLYQRFAFLCHNINSYAVVGCLNGTWKRYRDLTCFDLRNLLFSNFPYNQSITFYVAFCLHYSGFVGFPCGHPCHMIQLKMGCHMTQLTCHMFIPLRRGREGQG